MFRLKINQLLTHFITLLSSQFKQNENFVKHYMPYHAGSANWLLFLDWVPFISVYLLSLFWNISFMDFQILFDWHQSYLEMKCLRNVLILVFIILYTIPNG